MKESDGSLNVLRDTRTGRRGFIQISWDPNKVHSITCDEILILETLLDSTSLDLPLGKHNILQNLVFSTAFSKTFV